MTLIGIDFSLIKPAACIFSNNTYYFISWPHDLPEKIINVYKESGVEIVQRTDVKDIGENISSKMRYEIENSNYLAKLIKKSLEQYIYGDTYIAFEGLSYASSGDVTLQLSGYKYILMTELSKLIPLKNMFTYSPITIKSIAGCAKKGMNKKDMINMFIANGPKHKFRISLFEHPDKFQKIKSKNYITLLDDLIDAYFTLETLKRKENLF